MSVKLGPLPLDWTLTLVGALLLVAGFLVRRATPVAAPSTPGKPGVADVGSARDAVHRIAGEIINLQKEAPVLPMEQLVTRLDMLIKGFVLPVIEAQALIIDRQGFAAYAAHTSPWAGGERLVYRAWSAATDGHRPEALASLAQAVPHFEEAARNWPSNQ